MVHKYDARAWHLSKPFRRLNWWISPCTRMPAQRGKRRMELNSCLIYHLLVKIHGNHGRDESRSFNRFPRNTSDDTTSPLHSIDTFEDLFSHFNQFPSMLVQFTIKLAAGRMAYSLIKKSKWKLRKAWNETNYGDNQRVTRQSINSLGESNQPLGRFPIWSSLYQQNCYLNGFNHAKVHSVLCHDALSASWETYAKRKGENMQK